jgi:putative ABC transport system permease protein
VWIKKRVDIPDKVIYDSMKKESIELTELNSLSLEMYNAKNEIFLKGTNAILTLSFLSIAAITIIGFIIYWVLSLKSRALQFGIYRSLGLPAKGISRLLIMEQVLTLGSSVFMGAVVGVITGRLFLPLIKELWYSNKYVIPVKNISYNNEYLELCIILIAIFVFSLFILRKYISSLKIHQAIKLGED